MNSYRWLSAWVPFIAMGVLACSGDTASDELGDDAYLPEPELPARPSRFFLPWGEATVPAANPALEVDPVGQFHMVYPDHASGGAFYAFCDGDCSAADQVRAVKLQPDEQVDHAMIAIGPENKPHVLLSTSRTVYYATCSGDCTQQEGWAVNAILALPDHQILTGEAFALTREGKPRFLMHTDIASTWLGLPVSTHYVTCDSDCQSASSWRSHKIANLIWSQPTLRFAPDGQPRLATSVRYVDLWEPRSRYVAEYWECNTSDCTTASAWSGFGLRTAGFWVQGKSEVSSSLALTSTGAPRLALLAYPERKPTLMYFSCDQDCAIAQSWSGVPLAASPNLTPGMDLTLDEQDQPRLAYTDQYSIQFTWCDERCVSEGAAWERRLVEWRGSLPEAPLTPQDECKVSSWRLGSPSLALGADGLPRVAYGANNPSPGPGNWSCGEDGTPMTLPRFAQFSSLD